MANRRQLVKRRRTVRNIRKITRTMQLIATARFQKEVKRALATQPYVKRLAGMVEVASRAISVADQPLLKRNEVSCSALVVITSNRGFCGGYNGNVLRLAMGELDASRRSGQTVAIHAVGKKGINYLRFLGESFASRSTELADRPRFEQVAAMADGLMAAHAAGELAATNVCYMRFVSAGVQRPTVMQLLPLAPSHGPGESRDAHPPWADHEITYDYLPAPRELLAELLPATVRMRLFQCFTDAAVSEQIARMVAMKAATDAAGDMIKVLTQQYNRARQTAITMELLDIIGGVAAIS